MSITPPRGRASRIALLAAAIALAVSLTGVPAIGAPLARQVGPAAEKPIPGLDIILSTTCDTSPCPGVAVHQQPHDITGGILVARAKRETTTAVTTSGAAAFQWTDARAGTALKDTADFGVKRGSKTTVSVASTLTARFIALGCGWIPVADHLGYRCFVTGWLTADGIDAAAAAGIADETYWTRLSRPTGGSAVLMTQSGAARLWSGFWLTRGATSPGDVSAHEANLSVPSGSSLGTWALLREQLPVLDGNAHFGPFIGPADN